MDESAQNYESLIPYILGASGLGFAALKTFGYFRYQLETAKVIGELPPNLSLIELDAVDGKNVFYLPRGTDYTAVISIGERENSNKAEINEKMVLESIGRANRLN